ncbi:MAG: hypothetical protein U5K84_07970 [Alkalibacterium sp.]|nr:hypothetical protein [Alkalibacterium sp.]
MYLILSIFISITIAAVLFFLGNLGILIGTGIIAGTLFRIVFLLESINKNLKNQKDYVTEPSANKV